MTPLVGVVMGSKSDLETLQPALELLAEMGVPYEARILSVHRTPQRALDYAAKAESRGLRVIIAAAGGAAHLPGMVATQTLLPVLGVPVAVTVLNGVDALLSIVQMPKGVPVGTLAIGKPGAGNAASWRCRSWPPPTRRCASGCGRGGRRGRKRWSRPTPRKRR